MRLTKEDIQKTFTCLIDGRLSREEADRWAYQRMQAFDNKSLVFEPTVDESFLWDAIQYLYGIDTKVSSDEYMHSIEDIKETYKEKWSESDELLK